MAIDFPWSEISGFGGYASPTQFEPVSKEEFLAGRVRRFGTANPEQMSVPFWDHMIRSGEEPYWKREEYGIRPDEPIWSFARIGMSSTLVRERWIVYIGGEHDDYYDPDFLIYNDVIVRDLEGGIWVFCYPYTSFQPTDFHTATFIDSYQRVRGNLPETGFDDSILVIGGIGYSQDREWWRTPVYSLDLRYMRINVVETRGDEPQWIHHHDAHLTRDGRIRVSGGETLTENGQFVPNEVVFDFDLATRRWSRVS